MKKNIENQCYVVEEKFDNNNKIPYEDFSINRKNDNIHLQKSFPVSYKDTDLDEQLKNYRKQVKKDKKTQNNNKKPEENKKNDKNAEKIAKLKVEEQKRKEEAERKQRELEEQKRKQEEEARIQRELENKKRQEEAERKQKELEEQKRKQEEEARLQRELENKKRQEEAERKQRELEEQKRKQDEKRKIEEENHQKTHKKLNISKKSSNNTIEIKTENVNKDYKSSQNDNKDENKKETKLESDVALEQKNSTDEIIDYKYFKDLNGNNYLVYIDENNNKKVKKINENYDNQDSGISNYSGSILIQRIILVSFVLLFVFNIVLLCIVGYSIKNGGVKNIDVHNDEIVVYGDGLTTYAVQSAWQSSLSIAAGGKISDENSFFNNSVNRGSGVIYKIEENSAYILTCYHVVENYENSIYVLFSYYLKPIRVTVVGYSKDYDIAVLKADNIPQVVGQKAIKVYDSQMLSLGEKVFAIGNSLSSGLIVSSGVISMINREVNVDGGVSREIQTDTAINPGNSGGGLFNSAGEFIGLINAKLSTTKSGDSTIMVEGTSYAIPSKLVDNIVKSIIRNSGSATMANIKMTFKHSDGYISIQSINGKYIEVFEVRIDTVDFSSGAWAQAQQDDIVTSFEYVNNNGETIVVNMYNKYCFEDICFDIKENTEITFHLKNPLFSREKTVSFNVGSLKEVK